MHNAAIEAAGPQVEKFAAAGGRWLGLAVVATAAIAVATIVTSDPGSSLKGVFVCLAGALIAWVVLIRPVAAVHANGVLLRNMVRDTFVPASSILRCQVFQTIQVVTDSDRFHGLGVSRSARAMMKEQRGSRRGPGLPLGGGLGRTLSVDEGPGHHFADQEQTSGSYSEYVETRVTRLGEDARPDGREPVVAVAWPSVAALVAASVLLVLVFV